MRAKADDLQYLPDSALLDQLPGKHRAFHMEALVRLGATRAEIGDVLAMVVQMGGGPSLMYAAKALDCFDELVGARV